METQLPTTGSTTVRAHFFKLTFLLLLLSTFWGYNILLAQQSNSSTNLKREWLKGYQSVTGASHVVAELISGKDKNLTTVASARGKDGVVRLIIAKSNPDGEIIWQTTHSAPVSEGNLSSIIEAQNDNKGNTFVLMSLEVEPSVYNFYLLQFSDAGKLLWKIRIKDSSNPSDMVIAPDGSVYVSGTSMLEKEQYMAVAKISIDGRFEWLSKNQEIGSLTGPFNVKLGLSQTGDPIAVSSVYRLGFGSKLIATRFKAATGEQTWTKELNEGDLARGGQYSVDEVLVSPSGLLYIVGTHAASATGNDKPVILGLNTNGDVLWANIDNSPSYTSFITDADLDGKGDLVFLVSSLLGRSDTEIYLAKYTQTGDKSWGKLVKSDGRLLYPKALAISESGHIAVTGFSRGTLVGDKSVLFTRLISSAGEQIGIDNSDSTHETVGDAAAFSGSSLFVAGHTFDAASTTGPLFLVKYKTDEKPDDNTEQLRRSWAVSEAANEYPQNIAFDEQQNPIVTGKDFVISYSKMGEKRWEFKPKGDLVETAQAASRVGQNFVKDLYLLSDHSNGKNQGTVAVTKLNTAGNQVWQYEYQQQHFNIKGNSLAVNEQGEVFVVATVFNSNTDSYVKVVKLKADGQESWQSTYEGNSDFTEPTAADLVLGKQGEVYITGNFKQGSSLRRFFLAKFESDSGSKLKDKIYPENETATHYDPQKLFILADGSLYIAGTTQSYCISHPTAFVVKTDKDGNVLWNKRAGDGSELEMRDAAVAADGSVAVIGTYYNPKAGINTFFVSKINSQGEQLWFKLTNELKNVLISDNGNVIVTGNRSSDLYLGVFDKQGDLLQMDVYGDNGQVEIGTALAIDASGNLFVGGSQLQPDKQMSKLLLLKYSTVKDQICHIPVSVKLYLPPMAKRVGWQVRTTADFGHYIVAGKTGVRWTWGDGSQPTISYTADGTPRITGEHTYDKAGIYTIGLDFKESCLKPIKEDFTQQMVIFDPEAGNVFGQGELGVDMNSGNRNQVFNFHVRYSHKYAMQPSGLFHANLGSIGNLVSKSFDWLVISGNRAALQGKGSISGKGNYLFVATMLDAGNGQTKMDALRLQVWDLNAHKKLVYDNFSSNAAELNLMQDLREIRRGQIVINGNRRANKQVAQRALQDDKSVAYPNPFSKMTQVYFKGVKTGAYQVDLFDAQGNLVKQLQSGTATGTNQLKVEVNGEGLSEGLYLIKLSSKDGVKSAKVFLKH